jgi:hypothetical protein
MRWTVVLLAVVCGCEQRVENAQRTLSEQESEHVVAIVFDLSPSFDEKMTKDGVAFEFSMRVLDQYFRDSMGSTDYLIISQISAINHKPVIWQGTPLEMRQRFPTPESFNAFLKSKSGSLWSPIYEGMTNVIRYMMTEPSIRSGKAKSAVLVLSDMEDNGAAQWKQKVQEAIGDYAKNGGIMGLYYVRDDKIARGWRKYLEKSGMRKFEVQADFVEQPALPDLD